LSSIEWHIFFCGCYTKSFASPLKETLRLCGPEIDQPFFLFSLAILFRQKQTKLNIKTSKNELILHAFKSEGNISHGNIGTYQIGGVVLFPCFFYHFVEEKYFSWEQIKLGELFYFLASFIIL
jgi:hypothetical protein